MAIVKYPEVSRTWESLEGKPYITVSVNGIANGKSAIPNGGADFGVDSTVSVISITVTNSESTATPAPFQQLITLNPSIYSGYLASDLGNIRFYSDSGASQPLYSWVESGSSTSSSANIWVSLLNGIGANSSVTIYMAFYGTTVEFDGVYAGQAPQLSSTYGQYDNGAKVFNNYWNFAGTSLPSGWVSSPSSDVTVTVNNGVSVTQIVAGGIYGREGISLNTASSGTYIVDAYMAENGNDSGGGLALQNAEASSLTSSNAYTSIFLIYSYPSSLTWQFDYQNPSGTVNNPTSGSFTAGTYYVASLLISGSTASAQVNYGSTANFGSETGYTNTGYISFVTATATAGTNSQISAYWIRERTYVSSMPSFTVGSTVTSQTQTSGILEAFNYAGNNGIGTVLLKSGTYNVQTWPTLTFSNITVKGEGIHQTVIQASSPNSNNITSGNQQNVTFEDLDMIFTNPDNNGGVSMQMGQSVHNYTFRRIYTTSPGFQVGWVTSNYPLTDLTTSNTNYDFLFENCIFDASTNYNVNTNYMTVMGVDMKFIGCTFTTTTNITAPIISYGLSRPQIDGPHYFIGCTFNSQYVYLKIQQGYSPIIIGNSFLNNAGITTGTNADYPSNEGPNLGIRIIGNEFELTQSGTTQYIAIASGNTVGVGDYGMIIADNHFINVSGVLYTNTTTYPGGFFVYGYVTHALIENNVFENLGNPIMSQELIGAIKNNVFRMTLSQTGSNAGIVYVIPGGTYFIDFSGNINDGYTDVFINSGLTSSTGLIHDNVGISFIPTTPAVPASVTAQQNTNPYAVNVYLYGGTVTEIQITKNGTAYTVFSSATGLALSGQVYKLNPSDSITITYTTAPAWEWLSD